MIEIKKEIMFFIFKLFNYILQKSLEALFICFQNQFTPFLPKLPRHCKDLAAHSGKLGKYLRSGWANT